MKILYITPLLPESYLEQVLEVNPSQYVFAPQKFHRNLVEGFMVNGHDVQVLSVLPSFVDYKKCFVEKGIKYSFIPYTNKPVLKHFQVATGVFKKIRHDKSFVPDIVICDTLNASMCLGALATKKKKGAKIVGIVTDLPDSVSKYEKGLIYRASSYFSSKYINSFDYYVLLTEQMNSVVNSKNRPYIIMEGVCDIPQNINKDVRQGHTEVKRKLLYAGGRPSKDGVEMLITAFKQIPGNDLELNVYGSMPNVSVGKDTEDPRIVYYGKTDNSIIAEEERRSYLLVNPRPTGEEYTKYSFPSKVMEYMATGTPMVTTKLAGIPEEYFQYVYIFA